VPGDVRQDDGMPHRGVQAVLGDDVEHPSRGAGLPVLAARRAHRIGPSGWHIPTRTPLRHVGNDTKRRSKAQSRPSIYGWLTTAWNGSWNS
jgi:hypothetical protein